MINAVLIAKIYSHELLLLKPIHSFQQKQVSGDVFKAYSLSWINDAVV